MPKQTEHTYIDVHVQGGRGEVVTPDGPKPAYFFIFTDPASGERHVVPLTAENKAHVEKGWSGLEIARALPGVPGG